MNGDPNNLITLTVEGIEAEGGHVAADEFLDQLTHLLTALNGIDRLIGESGSPKLYYRIVKASHASPLQVTLEPILKKPEVTKRNYVTECHSRFFQELNAIKRREPVSEDVEPEVLEHLYDLAVGLGRNFKTAVISNDAARIDLDRAFEDNLSRLVREGDVSYGTFEGKLEAVNIHGGSRRFWLYPALGPQRVRCDFLPGTAAQVKEALGHYVRVQGLKHFRPPSPFPARIAVRDFEIVREDERVSINELRGIAPMATEGISAIEFVRRIRNEWD